MADLPGYRNLIVEGGFAHEPHQPASFALKQCVACGFITTEDFVPVHDDEHVLRDAGLPQRVDPRLYSALGDMLPEADAGTDMPANKSTTRENMGEIE